MYDLPHGKGFLKEIFQENWHYKGEFYQGIFHGDGEIIFNEFVAFKGKWRNFLLNDFLKPKYSLPLFGRFFIYPNSNRETLSINFFQNSTLDYKLIKINMDAFNKYGSNLEFFISDKFDKN